MNKKGAPDWTSASDDDDGDVVDDAAAKASTMAPMAMCEVDRQGRDRVEDSGRAFKTSACGALPSIASGMLMAAVAVCLSAEVPLLTFAREGDDLYSDRLVKPAPIGKHKVTAFQKYNDLRPILMVGDSLHDFPMMDYAHSAIFIDHHKDSLLTEDAKAHRPLIISVNEL